jgi:glutamate-1-semialdehyde aminotransferase/spore coat polysaccharide biosynthesis protein SpsF (cytidylyltransferase family)
MKTAAIIQARMASTRLPGKILAEVGGYPMLFHVVRRAQRAKGLDLVVVATSNRTPDDVVERFCEDNGIRCFRGSEDDVLDRYYHAAKQFHADVVVRLTADCPLLDPEIISLVVQMFRAAEHDYVSNVLECTFPDGLDTEVFSWQALERTWREARLKSEREHVTPFMRNHPELFRQLNVRHSQDLSGLRWTVDEPCDLDFVRGIYAHFGSVDFGMTDILDLLQTQPQLARVNAGIVRNEGYLKSLSEDRLIEEKAGLLDGTGQRLYARAKTRIPGGTQLLSKRPEMFLPEHWPSYYSKVRGVEVWDLDGNRFLDMSHNGIGACILGAADPDVDTAVKAAIDSGSMSTLNCPEEVELADLLCSLHPWAEMVRYARTGGEAMAVAVRLARAFTRRDAVAFCGYHGWHDWYLAANLAEQRALDGHLLPGLDPAGVPRGLLGTALPFRYNHQEELRAIVSKCRGDLAAIVMEPLRGQDPDPGFLEEIRAIATDCGAVLIFDEITAGFRLTTGGAHLLYGVSPDMAVFAKAISNGYPMAAIIGRSAVMEAAQSTFVSSTYWTERIGPTAALAMIRKHQARDVSQHLVRIGKRVQNGWRTAADRAGVAVEIGGIPPLSHFSFVGDQSQALHTLFTQRMLERGFLASKGFYATYAHQDEHVESYLKAVEETFVAVAQASQRGNVQELLKGPVAHSGFRRLT